MAAILNGLLPSRKKDQYAQERILNTRWGDAAISAPMHGGWNSNLSSADTSPELDRDLPPTPPQSHDVQDGVFIVRDEDDRDDGEMIRENASITITLPWKKKQKAAAHSRKSSSATSPSVRYLPSPNAESMLPLLSTAEAAAIPLPESRVSSPVGGDAVSNHLGRATTTSPVLSFRSGFASPNIGEMLSPVVEGFAKNGPSSRPVPVLSSLHHSQSGPFDQGSIASGRSAGSRRLSINSNTSYDSMGGVTMSPQSTLDMQAPEVQRVAPVGLAATAHMRASSRGPRAASVEPIARRAPPAEPAGGYSETSQFAEYVVPGALDLQPVRRRAPSVEPVRRRAPSVEPGSRRAPSPAPIGGRAVSREPRGRPGLSVEPRSRRRYHSETPRKQRSASFSSNDGSAESESEKGMSDAESWAAIPHVDRKFASGRPRRRRSIASPVSSPTASSFGITSPPVASFDSIAARADLVRPIPTNYPPPAQRNPPRNRSQSRTRGLYADMQDDFRLLARDVHLNAPPGRIGTPEATAVQSPATVVAPSPVVPAAAGTPDGMNSPFSQYAPSPALTSHPPHTVSSGIAAAVAMGLDLERTGYSSDSSLSIPPCTSSSWSHGDRDRVTDTNGGKVLLAAMARERKDQLRREERERAREKVIRKLEKEAARNALALSDYDSCPGTATSTSEKTKRVYGNTGSGGEGSSSRAWSFRGSTKELVKDAEEIWG